MRAQNDRDDAMARWLTIHHRSGRLQLKETTLKKSMNARVREHKPPPVSPFVVAGRRGHSSWTFECGLKITLDMSQ